MTIYIIDGKPHQLCDCDESYELCPRGAKRALQTCGFSRCMIPAPEAELARINPLYTAACIGQRDAEADARELYAELIKWNGAGDLAKRHRAKYGNGRKG